MTVTAVSCERV